MFAKTNISDVMSRAETSYDGSRHVLKPDIFLSNISLEIEKQWQVIIDNLCDISRLKDNWDGEGAEVPDGKVLESVIDLCNQSCARKVLPPTRVVVSPLGDIILEWQKDGQYLEAEISEPYVARWMLELPNKPTIHWKSNWRSSTGSNINSDDIDYIAA